MWSMGMISSSTGDEVIPFQIEWLLWFNFDVGMEIFYKFFSAVLVFVKIFFYTLYFTFLFTFLNSQNKKFRTWVYFSPDKFFKMFIEITTNPLTL